MAVLIKLGDNLVPVNSLIIGGKEPNLQEKNVDITSNGTIEVLPDGEYTGLSKVNINANVPNKFKSLVSGDIVNVTAEDLQGINNIYSYSFYSRSALKSVEIPGNITSIGGYSFQYCRALNNLILHEGIQAIYGSAFYSCHGLTEVIIPNTVTTIGQSAFSYCQNLTSITIPDSVTNLGNYAFSGCSKLTTVNLGNSLTSIPQGAFQNNPKLVNLSEIPNGVTSIENSAFYGCSGLTSITIGNGVTNIGRQTFYNCNAMELYDFRNCTVVPTLADTTLGHKDGCQIVVPDALYDEWITATNWSSLTNVVFVKASEYVEV